MKIVILDGYAANPGDLDYHLLEQLGEVVVYPRTSDDERINMKSVIIDGYAANPGDLNYHLLEQLGEVVV